MMWLTDDMKIGGNPRSRTDRLKKFMDQRKDRLHQGLGLVRLEEAKHALGEMKSSGREFLNAATVRELERLIQEIETATRKARTLAVNIYKK